MVESVPFKSDILLPTESTEVFNYLQISKPIIDYNGKNYEVTEHG